MLLLPFQLLAVLFPGGDSEDAFQGPTSFRVIQISSFANSTWAHNQGSGWLDDLQIQGWDSDLGTAIFLKPWSKGNISDEEVAELEELFQVYFFLFTQEIQGYASEFQLEYPFQIQGIAGCERHAGGSIVSFLRGALGGLDFLSFENDTCVPAPEGGIRSRIFCALIMQYKIAIYIVKKLLLEICPRYLLSVLYSGKAELQRQVKPEAWLSSGPSPGPGRLLLVCHVSGFYPKPVRVRWMQGEQDHPGTQHSDLLPNADWTWYLRVTLDVAAGEAAGLSCRVKHSSLEGQDIILYWVPSLILLVCLALWYKRRRTCTSLTFLHPGSCRKPGMVISGLLEHVCSLAHAQILPDIQEHVGASQVSRPWIFCSQDLSLACLAGLQHPKL
ncbi:T-cell surface glycoprotein CD1b-like isoform X2 [Lemur catta]|uniref:T-cell surface glycoprotein CD1b-like isoform X2 n=1 Tax=Lemur catta TaxID=9447 RepID=UPI001E269CA5|nr:T-cell surface glycoprotein CD1b-like isoform X2 [Lemur catta]